MKNLHLHESIRPHFASAEFKLLFEQFMALRGECVRSKEGRVTQRIAIADQYYYVKQHRGVGWREIIKNLLQLRLPVISARNEWLAIQKLESLKIPVATIAAYGLQGLNPACKQSFILTGELAPAISLEDLARNWRTKPPTFRFKHVLLTEVAKIARKLHESGMNHRDFYLCHFLLDTQDKLDPATIESCKIYLIDLHRAQIREKTPQRWVIKDIASLHFSSMDIGLTKRDLYRFIKIYRGKGLKEIFSTEKKFWQKVKMRGERLYRSNKHAET